MSTGPTHVYYNINITNNDTSSVLPDPIVSFNETRNTPYLMKPDDYYMTVTRFVMDTPTLPSMTLQPQLNDTDVNLLVYSVSLKYIDKVSQVFLSFTPQLLSVPAPVLPITSVNFINKYYDLYSYQWFIDQIVNPAFALAYKNLATKVLPTILPSLSAPFMLWDPSSSTAILNAPLDGYDLNLDNPIQIFFNSPMYTLFSSYPALSAGITATEGCNYLINSYDQQGLNIFKVVSSGISYIQVFQEYSTAPLWTPVTSIVFTTSMIPVSPEITAAPIVYQNNGSFQSIGGNANLTNVLTDFVVSLDKGTEYKPNVNYTPVGPYRFIDLFGRSPISSINVSVYYKNRFGTLIPITLSPGTSASIKILFRRKDFNNMLVDDY
jgi:hypothetical protein